MVSRGQSLPASVRVTPQGQITTAPDWQAIYLGLLWANFLIWHPGTRALPSFAPSQPFALDGGLPPDVPTLVAITAHSSAEGRVS